MQTRCLIVVVALAALAFVPRAEAKGPTTLSVCGASNCVEIPSEQNEDLVFGVLSMQYDVHLDSFVSPPPLAPYYELRFEPDSIPPEVRYVVPSAGALRAGGGWIRMGADTLAALERAAGGLEPWPAPELERVRVGGRETADVAPYQMLFNELAPAAWPLEPGERVVIDLDFGRATPWTDNRLEYMPRERLLLREADLWQAPGGLARAIERDAGPARTAPEQRPVVVPAPVDPASGVPWQLMLGAAASAGLITGAVVFGIGRRRRRHGLA
jgi:hypothetical protein